MENKITNIIFPDFSSIFQLVFHTKVTDLHRVMEVAKVGNCWEAGAIIIHHPSFDGTTNGFWMEKRMNKDPRKGCEYGKSRTIRKILNPILFFFLSGLMMLLICFLISFWGFP